MISTHWSSEDFIDELHDAYHDWLRSTLEDQDDWRRYVDHLGGYCNLDYKSNKALAAEFESHVLSELDMCAAHELDLDDMESMADAFGLIDLSRKVVMAKEEAEREPDHDSYERSEASFGEEPGSDDYMASLFGRLDE